MELIVAFVANCVVAFEEAVTVLVTSQNVLIHIFKVVINWFSACCHNNSAVCQEHDLMRPLSLFSKTRASQNPYYFNERLFAHTKQPVVVIYAATTVTVI